MKKIVQNIDEEKKILEYDYTFYRLQFDFEELLIIIFKKISNHIDNR